MEPLEQRVIEEEYHICYNGSLAAKPTQYPL